MVAPPVSRAVAEVRVHAARKAAAAPKDRVARAGARAQAARVPTGTLAVARLTGGDAMIGVQVLVAVVRSDARRGR